MDISKSTKIIEYGEEPHSLHTVQICLPSEDTRQRVTKLFCRNRLYVIVYFLNAIYSSTLQKLYIPP